MGLIRSKDQGRCQFKSRHQMQMFHNCREANVLCDIWELKFNGGIYFLISPRKGPGQANLGQISKLWIFLQNHAFVGQFCLRSPEMQVIFMYVN